MGKWHGDARARFMVQERYREGEKEGKWMTEGKMWLLLQREQ